MARILSLHLLGLLVLSKQLAAATTIPAHRYQLDSYPFEYGVASADPLADAVLIWTRASDQENVTWAIWLPGVGDFNSPVKTGVTNTSSSVDYTLTVDVTGLAPNTDYEYAFETVPGNRSRIGKTRTAPLANDTSFTSMKIGTFSCACHWCGYLNAYREMAADDTIDIVLGLGDWLYPTPYITAGKSCVRVPSGLCYDGACTGEGETLNVPDIPPQVCPVSDLREEMRHYHKILNTDVDARDLRAAKPMINIPDNHDIDDVQTNEFEPEILAWFEWVPTRYEVRDGNIFFPMLYRYGPLLDIVRLDTRNTGKNEDPPSYLGQEQIEYLETTVFGEGNKTEGWRVICTSQVFMPWTVRQEGYRPVVTKMVSGALVPLLALASLCFFGRLKRRKASSVGDIDHYDVDAKPTLDKTDSEDSTRIKKVGQNCAICCTSKACIITTLFFALTVLIAGIVFANTIERYFAPIESNPTGVGNIQQFRDRAWDGEGNPKDRAELLAQMKRLDAKNNIFVTGDMHIALAANVLDTAPGVGPTDTIPNETTHFGVEFLSSSVSKGNLDERLEGQIPLGLDGLFVPIIQRVFESLFYGSNDHFKYFETVHHGYGIIDLSTEEAVFHFRRVDPLVAGASSHEAKTLVLKKDENKFSDDA